MSELESRKEGKEGGREEGRRAGMEEGGKERKLVSFPQLNP
jgi:hypothetical protein